MQPPDDAHLTPPLPPAAAAAAAMTSPTTATTATPTPPAPLPKTRQSLPPQAHHHHHHPLAQSESSLPPRLPLHNNRRSTPSSSTSAAAASLFRSTLTPPGSRSASPAGAARSPARPSTIAMSGSVFGSPAGGIPGAKNQSLLDTDAADNPGDPLHLLLKSFVPHVAIHASEDVDGLVRDKGFGGGGTGAGGGLWELLRPFGERVQGKVMIRDSNGAARAWEDFAVRFVRFGVGVEEPEGVSASASASASANVNGGKGGDGGRGKVEVIAQVETVVERHLRFAEEAYVGSAAAASPPMTPTRTGLDVDATSPYYALYLRRLLSGMPLACHESFAHPVACVMAISSRNPAPIEALQKLYRETSQGERSLPPWVDGDYLRYYILVHDEETGDITKSMALFEQMKRNFGLHCHLLRLRSTQSAETDDDSIPLPRSDWMTAAEELADIEASETREDFEDPTRYIFESDATAIRTFVREMVTQSVIPTMERNVSVWNDQVASRRRGLSGRFMSLSKRWAFGSSSRASGGGSSSSSNYDALGFYRADSPEAIMRRLADFAFMLRDWKLAMSTYDLLRGDFQNDKAWKYHASANEMAALALLIMPQNMSSKTRIETINQMLEQAFYSYQIRCNSLYGAVRCTVLALELLRLRGGSGVDESVRWGIRVLESKLMGNVGDALLRERMAICYAAKQGAGSQAWGSRRRKSALWSVLSAEAWIAQAKYVQAQKCLNDARRMYALLPGECGVQNFGVASDFLAHLNDQLKAGLRMDLTHGEEYDADQQGEAEVDEESETLGNKRSRRASLIAPAKGGAALETAPLNDTKPARLPENERDASPDDGFG